MFRPERFIDIFWIRNASFLIILIAVVALSTGLDKEATLVNFFQGVYDLLFSYVLCLVHNTFLLPLAIRQRKLINYLVLLVLYLILIAWLADLTIRSSQPEGFISNLISAMITIFAGSGIYLFYTWINEGAFESKRQLWKAQEELRFLKEQTNPHFLMNALNSLYAVALTKPNNITDKIAELSFLLRYQLEATQKQSLRASEEIEFVKAYISYQQSITHALSLDFQVSGTPDQVMLPPLLFFPLIENALKYSAETDHAKIEIVWRLSAERVEMMIRNNFLNEGSKIQSTKFGHENLLQRLQAHKIKYQFQTEIINGYYQVNLSVWIESINV